MLRLEIQRRGLVAGASVLVWLSACSHAWSADEARTLTDRQGRSIDATIQEFNPETQAVTLQRSDGKSGKMLLGQFSEADQVYIRDWAALADFMNRLSISAQLGTEPVSGSEAGGNDVSKMVIDSSYTVRCVNRSASTFEKINVEYCLFYRQGERDGSTVNYDEGICYGKEVWKSLAPSGEVILKTKSVRLYSEMGGSTIFGRQEFSDANVRGIWLRLKTKLPSGKEAVREYRTADDKIWKWVPRSIGVGLNPGASPYRIYQTF